MRWFQTCPDCGKTCNLNISLNRCYCGTFWSIWFSPHFGFFDDIKIELFCEEMHWLWENVQFEYLLEWVSFWDFLIHFVFHQLSCFFFFFSYSLLFFPRYMIQRCDVVYVLFVFSMYIFYFSTSFSQKIPLWVCPHFFTSIEMTFFEIDIDIFDYISCHVDYLSYSYSANILSTW